MNSSRAIAGLIKKSLSISHNANHLPIQLINQKSKHLVQSIPCLRSFFSLSRSESQEQGKGDPLKSDVEDNELLDSLENVSREELIDTVKDMAESLKTKQKEIEEMHEKVLRSYAESQNIIDRTWRDSETAKKFAIQSFAKSLLDVADNLGRASSVGRDSFSKLGSIDDSSPAFKTLLEGVEMTEKQLNDVFKKYGVMKYDPANEQFDPHKHMAVFQVPSLEKQPGTVAAVLKSGYTLHDRVIRPAEVGVVAATE